MTLLCITVRHQICDENEDDSHQETIRSLKHYVISASTTDDKERNEGICFFHFFLFSH